MLIKHLVLIQHRHQFWNFCMYWNYCSYFVKNEQGSVDTQWWNSAKGNASYIDFTNPEAAAWWSTRLRNLQTMYGIDSFKFDAGESSWSPQVSVKNSHWLKTPKLYYHKKCIVMCYQSLILRYDMWKNWYISNNCLDTIFDLVYLFSIYPSQQYHQISV